MARVSAADSQASVVVAPDDTSAQGADAERAAGAPAAGPVDPGLSLFAGVLLGYVMLMAALATLSPFDFVAKPVFHHYAWWFSGGDVALNLVLLFPAGFLLRLSRRGRGYAWCLDALGLGLMFSMLLELLQAYLPARVTSPIDVLTNGLGAWAGAALHERVRPWLDRRLHQQLSLHLPLANILYLLVPLYALDALSLSRWQECIGALPLVAFTAWIAAALYKHRLLGGDGPFAWRFSLAIGCLLGFGYVPAAVRFAAVCPLLSVCGTILTRASIAAEAVLTGGERRFVVTTVRRALPWFVGYLFLLGCRAWLSADTSAAEYADIQTRVLILLRDVAAFTLLGYLVSELHAREPLRPRDVLERAAALGMTLAAISASLHLRATSLQVFQATLSLSAAAVLGAIIHRAQLRLVRSWGHSLRPPSR